jgi:branched-chain amino acid transport system substrate-binding protein
MNRLLWVLAGCALAAATPALAQVSDNKVSMALLIDMSGPFSALNGPGSVTAAELAVEDFGGTVLGAPIEIKVVDMQNKPDVASTAARSFFDSEQGDAIVESNGTAISIALQQLAAERNKIAITSASGSPDITGKDCVATGFQWAYDTRALTAGIVKPVIDLGATKWFFITPDYQYGLTLEKSAMDEVTRLGGTIAGSIHHPQGITDFSSYILQAQASGADVVAFASVGSDLIAGMKQAAEYGLGQTMKLTALQALWPDIRAIGLDSAGGMMQMEAYFWGRDADTQAFADRFFEKRGIMPTSLQASTYSSVTHYLQSVEAAGTDATDAVVAKMRELPVTDFFAPNGVVRPDNKMIHDMYLLRVKTPEESKGEWDLYDLVATVPGDEAFLSLEDTGCPLVVK